MFCAHCGNAVHQGDHFCRVCGSALNADTVSAQPVAQPAGAESHAAAHMPASGRSRIERHINALAILWIVISVFRAFAGLAVLWAGHAVLPNLHEWVPDTDMHPMPFIPPFVPALVSGIGIALLVFAVFGLAVGWGLLQRESWARVGALILGIISLVEVPIGTVIGIYTLWVLLSSDSEQEYRALARY